MDDPIAALASAPGMGGVALIRLSGAGVYPIVDALAPRLSPRADERPAGTFAHTLLVDPADGSTLDDAVLLFYRAPHSYTGEDTIELCVHGGPLIPERVLGALYRRGARPAEPGEFTRRAFLNGRLDLTQAESVADLIAARTPRAEAAARAALMGRLGRALDPLYRRALALAADIEHALDFDEGDLPPGFLDDAAKRLAALAAEARRTLAGCRDGDLLTRGATVALAGPPNAGKSTLLNLLLRQDRAIVSPEPGTTRDTIAETLDLDGVPLRLVDTAGLRDAPGAIEREGIARTRRTLAEATLTLFLIPAGEPLPHDLPAAGRTLVIRTKGDLTPGVTGAISALADPEGARAHILDRIRTELNIAAGETDTHTFANARQYAGLSHAVEALTHAEAALPLGEPGLVPAAQHLRDAATALATLLGHTYTEDLLDRIFSTFCVGK